MATQPVYYGVTKTSTDKRLVPYPTGVVGEVTYAVTIGSVTATVSVPDGAGLYVPVAAAVRTTGTVTAPPPPPLPPVQVVDMAALPTGASVTKDSLVPVVVNGRPYLVPIRSVLGLIG